MKRSLPYLLLLLIPLGAMAQGVVEGVVRDSVGGALPYAVVGVDGTPLGTTADANGRYRLRVEQGDSITLRFSCVGYRTRWLRTRVQGTMHVDMRLSPMAHQLKGVEIESDQVRQSEFTTIDVQRLEDAVGPTGGVEGLVKLLPDVQSNNELSSQYSVRGGSFDENLVYIGGIEVIRPVLVRNAQQEGMSIINPDLVSYILFSPGGFDATYGDRLSSVLDITYGRPTERRGRASASLLGGSLSLQGPIGDAWHYAVGLRHHSNNYILSSLDTKGAYTTAYTDLQAIVGYHPSDKLDITMMLIGTRNVYNLIPESQTTSFGGFFNPMTLRIYFDGQEQDRYHTWLGSASATYRPTDDWTLRASLSAQRLLERESYDVQDQYFLYEVAMGDQAGDTLQFDRGVGTFLEHARNRLQTTVRNLDLRAIRQARLGTWQAGIKLQSEQFTDHLREWRWVDSAGYSIPSHQQALGQPTDNPVGPVLQRFVHADNSLHTLRGAAFVQRDAEFSTHGGAQVRLVGGVRGQLYQGSHARLTPMISPRVGASLRPNWKRDILFRFAAGIYEQSPLYREYRRANGSLAEDLPPQRSVQAMASADWRFSIDGHPFALTADVYYKYLTHLIPYTVDNLRITYEPDRTATGYATGLSLRVGGELREGLESWASLSLMRTAEDIEGDGLGFLPRHTDQRVSFKLFLQDNLPSIPWWRMSLSLVYGSGTPISEPGREHVADPLRLKPYYRVDWGNTVQLMQFAKVRSIAWIQALQDVQVSLEVFNLFNFRNVVSYLWVSDYEGTPFRVPNYLTARQINLKLTLLF